MIELVHLHPGRMPPDEEPVCRRTGHRNENAQRQISAAKEHPASIRLRETQVVHEQADRQDSEQDSNDQKVLVDLRRPGHDGLVTCIASLRVPLSRSEGRSREETFRKILDSGLQVAQLAQQVELPLGRDPL